MAIVVVVAACASRSAPPAKPIATVTPAPTRPAEPEKKKVTVTTETHFEILDPIKFLPGSATIETTSIPMLDAVARTLAGNPSIKLVAVQAFGADTVARFQVQLGATRAQTIVDALVARGVEAKRLLPEGNAQPPAGYPNAPIFLILERVPSP
jgi:outer membrane protein OmpA-like peptidoglycan-associated protein